jgi:hypothetical protein
MANEIIAQSPFLQFLISLAPEDETTLFVCQKPVMVDGIQAVHKDGSLKYTWPASMPEKIKAHGSWYGNTGSFMLDRMPRGKVSASKVNCEYVLVMVLDDIGTKSAVPPLEPTWKMETSPGNFQWGYAFNFDHQPKKADFCAAIEAIAAAGFTDAGATNEVRNFRLPGSPNLKPGKNNFASVLVEFHPDRLFTLEQILTALSVVPGESSTASFSHVTLADTGDDDVLEFLHANQQILEPGNGAGWWGVICPNHENHSDGNPMARYHPVNRSFCCLHEHCTTLDSAYYLKLIADNGGPEHVVGLKDEAVSGRMASALSKLKPSPLFSSPADAVKEIDAREERKELDRVSRDEWYTRFMYVQQNDAYFDMTNRRMLSRASFNALMRGTHCKSIHNKRKIEASVAFDELRVAQGASFLINLTYAAGDPPVVERGDADNLYGNRWVDARPDLSDVIMGDISLWLGLTERLIPVVQEREHVLDIMAFKLQKPTIKINHAVLHVGDEGCGKDTMWAPFIWSVCGSGLRNRGYMDSDTIDSQWGYALESEILIINELKEPDASARRAMANKLKPIIAAPPEMLDIQRKHEAPYQMANRLFVLAYSNEQIPISLASQDRRWFCLNSQAPRMTPEEANRIWAWYTGGGFGQIALWLSQRDVSKFNPAEAPSMTDYKANLIENGRSMSESFILDMITLRQGEFAKGVIGGPFNSLCERLALSAPNGSKVPKAALLHSLKEAGWKDLGLVCSKDNLNKRHLFAAPDMVEARRKSALRNLVEEIGPSKVTGLRAVGK